MRRPYQRKIRRAVKAKLKQEQHHKSIQRVSKAVALEERAYERTTTVNGFVSVPPKVLSGLQFLQRHNWKRNNKNINNPRNQGELLELRKAVQDYKKPKTDIKIIYN